ncbi:PucR family transcriptional regulator [Paenibacillus thailandensis]|uniref:PucR family transcriptional regulator n=1 Tax=Paenibacillus thailandensis TaxID=393250 RepID=A0ABW5QTX9_9BACL
MLLEDLLNVPMLKNARIAAGKEGLKRDVESVNMMDSPDVIDYVKPKELTLTTAYAIKDKPEYLIKLICEMADRGCAGLGIKTKRYLDRIPEQAKETADRLRFPLLELPADCSLAEAIEQLLSRILAYRTDELRHALDSHRKFSTIILEGNSLQDMIDTLSELLSLPVLLMAHNEPLAISPHFRHLPPERIMSLLKDIPVPKQTGFMTLGLQAVDSGPLSPYAYLACYPIHSDLPKAYLLIWSDRNGVDAFASLTIEQAVNVISFELMKRQAVKERSRRYKYDFFSDVVEGVVTNEADIGKRGRKYGLVQDRSYSCAVFKQDPFEREMNVGMGNPSIPEKERLYELIKQEAKEEHIEFILFVKQDGLVMLLPEERPPAQDEKKSPPMQLRLQRIVDRIWENAGISISAGIGNPADRFAKLPQSYREALDALQTGYQSKKQRFVQYFCVKELNDLLRLLPPEDMEEFIQDTFKGLLQVEEKERAELKKTLRAFFEHHCHIADTSKHLYLHRNTVIYRLDKCERLTGRPLRSIPDSLRFRVAFQMEDVMGKI